MFGALGLVDVDRRIQTEPIRDAISDVLITMVNTVYHRDQWCLVITALQLRVVSCAPTCDVVYHHQEVQTLPSNRLLRNSFVFDGL